MLLLLIISVTQSFQTASAAEEIGWEKRRIYQKRGFMQVAVLSMEEFT